MSIESDLISALSATNIPVVNGVYTGTAATYITFNYWSNPIWDQDDAPTYERIMITVNLFAPMTANITALKKQIKTLLFAAGYTYPSERNLSGETYGRQIAFETEVREAV